MNISSLKSVHLYAFIMILVFQITATMDRACAGAEEPALTIHISAHDDKLPHPIEVMIERGAQRSFHTTDQDGEVVVQSLPEGDGEVYVSLAMGFGHEGPIRTTLHDHYKNYSQRYALPDRVRVDLDAQGPDASIEIVLGPAYTVSGRLVMEGGVPTPGYLSLRGFFLIAVVGASGEFEFFGAPADTSAHLIAAPYEGAARRLLLTPPDNGADAVVELGDITLAPVQPDVEIRIQLIDLELNGLAGYDCGSGVTLISADGERAMLFLATATGFISAHPDQPDTGPRITEGDYYVVPCDPIGELAQSVWDAIEAGVDLEAGGIPLIEAHGPGPVSLEVSVAETVNNILQMKQGQP